MKTVKTHTKSVVFYFIWVIALMASHAFAGAEFPLYRTFNEPTWPPEGEVWNEIWGTENNGEYAILPGGDDQYMQMINPDADSYTIEWRDSGWNTIDIPSDVSGMAQIRYRANDQYMILFQVKLSDGSVIYLRYNTTAREFIHEGNYYTIPICCGYIYDWTMFERNLDDDLHQFDEFDSDIKVTAIYRIIFMSVWRTTFDIDYFNIVSASSGSENIPPSISITNPPPNSYYELWETVPVRAEVSDPDGSISEVRFYENGNFRSVAGSAPYGCDIAAQPIGTVTITAIAIDNEGAATESEPVDIRVVEYGDPGYIEWSKNGDVIYYNQGPVGIGTYFPGDYELNVIGRIRADEIVVNTEHADFVFGENYCLPPLQQVEEYIKVHQHLPDIVSADEVKENGVGLGELQARLLQKIEELTLYIIEQQKRIELLEQKISETGDE